MAWKKIYELLKKDILLEWRQQYAFYGIILYVGTTVFAVYMMNGTPGAKVWNALFWITQLFISVTAVAKSFLQEPVQRFRYYYTIVHPNHYLMAKMLYSILLMFLMSLVSLIVFNLLLGTPFTQVGLFILISFTGSCNLALVFTFLSAIAARTNQNASLMAILGFPIIIPFLMMLSNLSLTVLSPVYQPGWWMIILLLVLLDFLIVILGLILFPYLWKE